MRADRLLSFLLLLQTRGRMTATALAERLEVSVRTIYRDLDALSAAGVPVYAERGASGGCVLRPGYRTDLTGLNESEVASLFGSTAGKVLHGLGLNRGLRSALVKLEAALPAAHRSEAERVRARLYIDAAAWFESNEPVPHLAAVREAVFADRAVRLTYQRGDGQETTRRVDPLGLVVKGGIWYLVALRGAGLRVFRVSRIRAVRHTKEPVARPPRFSLETFWNEWSRDFVARIPQYSVTLRVRSDALALLPQVFGERARTAIVAGRAVAGGTKIELTFDSLESACGNLMRLGNAVEVIEPKELRAALRTQAEAVARLYAGDGGVLSARRSAQRRSSKSIIS
jgi:predicted DNA-binding transcriptional regulator YafY